MGLLYWFESIRNPVLDGLMQFFTYFGEELLFMVLALVIFWCVEKREGYYLLFIGFFGTVLNQWLKLLCRIPRPWVRDPQFTIVESARAGAGGYSFPSGHTQNAVGTLGGMARWTKRRWVRIGGIALLLLTSISRMYLGVHTPADVGVSFLIAGALVFAFYPLVRWAAEKPARMFGFLGVLAALALAFVLYANCTAFPADIDPDNLYEGQKNSFSLLGALLGFIIAYPIERRYIRFNEKAPLLGQILKVVLGMGALLAVKELPKLLLNAMGVTWVGTNLFRYGLVVLFAALVWPLTFPFFAKIGKRKK